MNCDVVGLRGNITFRLHAAHTVDLRDPAQRARRQRSAAREAGAHANAAARARDLPEDETVAALDELHDPLRHRAERDEPATPIAMPTIVKA